MDVKYTFFTGYLEEEICIEKPLVMLSRGMRTKLS